MLQNKKKYFKTEKEFNTNFFIGNRIIQYFNICDEINSFFIKKSPINGLQELAQYSKSKLQFIDVAPELAEENRFIVSAKMNDRTFTKVEAYKLKDAKTGAAYLAWKILIIEKLNEFDHMISSTYEIPAIIELLTHKEYFVQVLKDPLVLTGKKIIASIIKQEEDPFNLRVVAFGTGNRCIQGCNLSLDGNVVNDSHAEIISRRAFVRYLYTEIEAFYSDKNSIFKMSSSGDLLELKQGITFHLFISCSPCGDASVFTKFLRNAESAATADDILNYSKKVQGLLRSKIEAGEGDIPILTDEVHTFLGFLFGKRLRTMSCSDKVLKWNVLGLQGCLLTHFIRPIYLSSVVIGENFQEEHLTRAIYKRILTMDTMYLIEKLPVGFRLNKPQVFFSNLTLNCQYDSEKSSAWSAVWFKGLVKAEVYDGTTGVFFRRSSSEFVCPCITKLSIYGAFKRLCMITNKNQILQRKILNSQIIKDYDTKSLSSAQYGDQNMQNRNLLADHHLYSTDVDSNIVRYSKTIKDEYIEDSANINNTMILSDALFSNKVPILGGVEGQGSLNNHCNASTMFYNQQQSNIKIDDIREDNSKSNILKLTNEYNSGSMNLTYFENYSDELSSSDLINSPLCSEINHNVLNRAHLIKQDNECTFNVATPHNLSTFNEPCIKKAKKLSCETSNNSKIFVNGFCKTNSLEALFTNYHAKLEDTIESKNVSITYGGVKKCLSEYRAAKAIFEECVKKSGCGCWLSKPEEIDYFS